MARTKAHLWLLWALCVGILGAVPFNLSLAAEPVRLVVFGTSLTAQYDWPEALTKNLAVCLNRPVDLQRVAMPGANSEWALEQLPTVTSAVPNIVLIEFAINDADVFDGIRLDESREHHTRIVRAMMSGENRPDVFLMTMNPVSGIHRLVRLWLSVYYEMVRNIADEQNVSLVDTELVWQALLNDTSDETFLPDGLHPQHEAMSLVARYALQAISEHPQYQCVAGIAD